MVFKVMGMDNSKEESVVRQKNWNQDRIMRNGNGLDQQFAISVVSPEGLDRTQIAGPHPRESDSVGLGWGLKISISNRFLGAAEPHLEMEEEQLRSDRLRRDSQVR